MRTSCKPAHTHLQDADNGSPFKAAGQPAAPDRLARSDESGVIRVGDGDSAEHDDGLVNPENKQKHKDTHLETPVGCIVDSQVD
jgi:hypothetical protein